MGSYQILDYLSRYMPTATQMGMAQALSFSAYTPSISFMAIYDHEAKYYESEDYASLRDLFRVNFTEGATYHIYSSSFFDPFLLSVHDSQGRFIAVDNGTTYGSDSISHFIAPYTGTYYVNASWDQGYADSHKFVYLSILEDIDTATPADSTPPTVIAFSPTDEAAGIAITENIVVTFSEAIQRGTGSIVLKTASGIPVATYNASASSNLSVSGSTLTINPTNILVYGTGYKIEFATGSIKDMAGNICAGTTSYNFTTTAAPDITAPTIITYSPTDGATTVGISDNIILTFSEPVQRGTGSILLKNATGSTIETFDAASASQLSISGSTLTIDPTNVLTNGTNYYVTFTSGTIKDLARNTYTGTTSYHFTTAASASSIGTAGNDTINGGAFNEIMDGGAGIDTVIFSGNLSDYTITKTTAGFTLSGGGNGTNTLCNIERIQFADCQLALDLDGNAGNTAKILGAVFGSVSVSNKIYAGIGLGLLDGGMSYEDLAALALTAAGASTSQQVVNLLWTNIVGSPPTVGQAQLFVDMLNGGITTGQFGVLAADTTLNQQNINLIGLTQTGLEFA